MEIFLFLIFAAISRSCSCPYSFVFDRDVTGVLGIQESQEWGEARMFWNAQKVTYQYCACTVRVRG